MAASDPCTRFNLEVLAPTTRQSPCSAPLMRKGSLSHHLTRMALGQTRKTRQMKRRLLRRLVRLTAWA
jgi:hypothetical protein